MILYCSGQSGEAVVTSVKVIMGDGSQLSVEVAFPVAAGKVLVLHWIVIFAGHVTAGADKSETEMV